MNKEEYLGVYVSTLTYDEIIKQLKDRIATKKTSTIIAVNPEKLVAAERDIHLKELINSATFQIPDGTGVLLASKLNGGKIRSRVTGIDMMERLIQFAANENHRVYLYGAKEEVVSLAKVNLEKSYPKLEIVGYSNGYETDNKMLVQKINDSKATLLFVALGSPRQELWIRDHMDLLPDVKVFQGVGGSFDVFAGHVKRAPKLFRKLGLEWFYRLITDPRRIKRQLVLPLFLFKIIFQQRRNRGHQS